MVKLTYLGTQETLENSSISELKEMLNTPNLNSTSRSQIAFSIKSKLKKLFDDVIENK